MCVSFIITEPQQRKLEWLRTFYFLTAIRLPQGQLWAILKGTADVNHCDLIIWPEGLREPRKEVGSLSPAEHLVGFEPSDSNHNAITH